MTDRFIYFDEWFDEAAFSNTKARFLLRITTMDERRIEGKKITFTVQEMLCGKKTYADAAIPIDLMDIGAVEKLRNVEYTGGGVRKILISTVRNRFFSAPWNQGSRAGNSPWRAWRLLGLDT